MPNLTKLTGDYQSWKPFNDLFTPLVIDNPDLPDVSKMHYLKTSLEKEAYQLIYNFQGSGENLVVYGKSSNVGMKISKF